MYGHHIIEDLEAIMGKTNVDNLYKNAAAQTVKELKKAQYFYLGAFQDIQKPLEHIITEESSLFMGDCAENARLPYSTCCFQFDNVFQDVPLEKDFPKRAVLVKASEVHHDRLLVTILSWSRMIESWLLSPQVYYISVGTLLKDQPDAPKNIENSHGNVFPMPITSKLDGETSKETAKDDQRDLHALNAAILLLNCKNIETVTNLPPTKLNKKRRKKGRQEIFEYKTLRLVLPGEKNGRKDPDGYSAGVDPSGTVPVHLCRGHFKQYTKEAPLFGKYTGLYWWQPHVRGSKERGVVVKDYSVDMDPSKKVVKRGGEE